MDEQPNGNDIAKGVVQQVVRYGGTERMPLLVAMAVAVAARESGVVLTVRYRDRWSDGLDPSALFLLGIDSGDELVLEATGAGAGELLDILRQMLECPPTVLPFQPSAVDE